MCDGCDAEPIRAGLFSLADLRRVSATRASLRRVCSAPVMPALAARGPFTGPPGGNGPAGVGEAQVIRPGHRRDL